MTPARPNDRAIGARTWVARYRRRLVAGDAVVVIVSVFMAQFAQFGFTEQELLIALASGLGFTVPYTVVSVLLVAAWLFALAVGDSRDPRILGAGPLEYRRIVNLTFLTFGFCAIGAYVTRAELGRGYLIVALPLGLALLLISRWFGRARLRRERARGKHLYRTLIVGDRQKTAHVARQIIRDQHTGFQLVGAVTSCAGFTDPVPGLAFVAGYEDLLDAVDRMRIDAVIMTSADEIDPARKREIGWALESRSVDLVVAAALTDVAGPRMHVRPVAGLPLLHIDHPKFAGGHLFAKRLFDIVVATALLVVTFPLFLATALAVKLSSPGPVFYAQERIGRGGQAFPMFKFRSMVQGADDQLESLLDLQGTAHEPLHKIANDPRITPVGRFIRRYSIDELPQLVNVLLGTMSLVGPRPHREAEVALYTEHELRRLLVRPGMSGLWQVSGRSNLNWADAVRLDLAYVENWSMVGDLILLMRTVRAVVRPDGAR
ncbi:sugar transferase [Leucobacter sp. USHLN153]|uniref:sugar transferase n=1 Tax=Leucobacter sp. USHLN153 TaxID=3081268 RepID=UPI00301970DB